LIQTFGRPGGNITGVTELELALGPKRLEVLQEMIPELKRVLFLYNEAEASAVRMANVYRNAARNLGIKLIEKAVRTEEEARATVVQVRKSEVDGLLAPSSVSLNLQGLILEASAREKIPAMFSATFFAEHGGLVSYAPDTYETGKQAAQLVDKILKGADPAGLPVEVNQQIEFVINLKVAKAMGLTIAPDVLYKANRLVR